jgi:hypothetical protein
VGLVLIAQDGNLKEELLAILQHEDFVTFQLLQDSSNLLAIPVMPNTQLLRERRGKDDTQEDGAKQ